MISVGDAVVYFGDCREKLKLLPDNSVDSVVTDPPYELGFMGKSWDNSGIAYDVSVWAECLRVLKPGGHILAFGGSRTWHRLAVAVEDAGFELRDSIAWLYGSGFPKSLNVSKAIDKRAGAEREILHSYNRKGRQSGILGKEVEITRDITAPSSSEAKTWQGWGTALKPAFEPIVVGRKPFGKGVTVAENVLAWGVGGLNIDGSRIGSENRVNTATGKRSQTVTAGGSFGGESGGYNFAPGNTESVVQGRWPANVILDEVTAGLLDEQSGISRDGVAVRRNGNSGAGMFPVKIANESADVGFGGQGGASRFFYVAKASKRDRNEGLEELEAKRHADRVVGDGPGGENPRNRTNQAKQNFHPTVKPTQLMRYLIKLVTPEGGTVLDPFTGSGSTGKAALLDGYKFVGVELTEEYLPIIEGRLKWASEQEGETDERLF